MKKEGKNPKLFQKFLRSKGIFFKKWFPNLINWGKIFPFPSFKGWNFKLTFFAVQENYWGFPKPYFLFVRSQASRRKIFLKGVKTKSKSSLTPNEIWRGKNFIPFYPPIKFFLQFLGCIKLKKKKTFLRGNRLKNYY